jgi:multidrug efflux pump subunit AcrA (membrane-fusion protein)
MLEKIKQNRRFIPVAVVILFVVIYGSYLMIHNLIYANTLVVTGTIEATEIHLGVSGVGTVDHVFVQEGDPVQTDQLLANVRDLAGSGSGNVRSPINGIVLMRAAEPGEITSAGGALLVVADLTTVTLTVYVPEDMYGKVQLGQVYKLHVDSYPQNTYMGTVTYIAGQAEFTPRNATSLQNRKNTVYAVKMTINNANLELKPGMPADVTMKFK